MPDYNKMSFARRFDTVHAYYNALKGVQGPFLSMAQAVLNAGIAVMPLFHKENLIIYAKDGRQITRDEQKKLGAEFLTEADRVSHEAIATMLTPNAGGIPILYEESIKKISGNTLIAVDEIDGSGRFLAGEPGFMILTQFIQDGKPVLSMNYNPLTQQLYYAVKGQGSYRDGVRVEALDQSVQVDTARVLLTNTDKFNSNRQGFLGRMQTQLGERLECRLATGSRMTAVLDGTHHACVNANAEHLHVWDLGMYLNILEVGGTVTRIDGSPIRFAANELVSDFVCAANARLAGELREIVIAA